MLRQKKISFAGARWRLRFFYVFQLGKEGLAPSLFR